MSTNPFITPFDSLPSTLPIFPLPGTDHHQVITLVPLHDNTSSRGLTAIQAYSDRRFSGISASFFWTLRGQAAVRQWNEVVLAKAGIV